MAQGASTLVMNCTRRCQGMPNAFRPSALVAEIHVCRYCGAQQRQRPAPPPVASVPEQGTQQPVLYTLGYAGVQLEAVLRALLERRISVLVDCRWDTSSGQLGFDGATLRRAVEGRGIAYRHFSMLGGAPHLRFRLCEEGDWDAFAAAYLTALAPQEELLGRIAGWARNHPTCLLSCERNATLCHRGLLATRLAEMAGLQVEHLLVW
ncbi:MAG TPA: DUF488 domain-containing protein [Ktedonobacterales bacterium]|nr:DUF488 domain-containing protein [Ktedonobacterales bacterium]